MDDASWAALTLGLTALGAVWTWLAFRHRGAASGLRALGFTLLPLAAYLTKTLRMFTRIVDAIADWALSLVFNPVVWSGVVLAGVGVALIVASAALRPRERRGAGRGSAPRSVRAKGPDRDAAPPAEDDDLADVEALLRRRGIT